MGLLNSIKLPENTETGDTAFVNTLTGEADHDQQKAFVAHDGSTDHAGWPHDLQATNISDEDAVDQAYMDGEQYYTLLDDAPTGWNAPEQTTSQNRTVSISFDPSLLGLAVLYVLTFGTIYLVFMSDPGLERGVLAVLAFVLLGIVLWISTVAISTILDRLGELDGVDPSEAALPRRRQLVKRVLQKRRK